jgi:exopolysaccharide biosynthesis protein
MVHNKRKAITAAAISLILAVSPLGTPYSAAQSNIINETSTTQTITQGVSLENIVRFTTSGWYNINIIRIDLSDPYIKVDTLTNTESIGNLTSTKTLASQQGAVAAINASFFSPDGGSKGHPLGTIMASENIYAASSDFNRYGDVMGTFALTKLNEVVMSYWKTQINLAAPNGTLIPVAQYNKPSGSKYTDISIYDRKWGQTAVGTAADMPDVVQMVVEDGRVTQFLTAQPAAQIPQNGYVVVTRDAGGKTLQANFVIGDSVSMSIATSPDWTDSKMAVTGCSVLVKDGKIPSKFSYDVESISKSNPRSVVASSKDGKQLFLVTVDGRQTSSIGMTQLELAQYMQGIGAWNALNLDGGGSTTMVARPLGDTSVQLMNSPSDGMTRAISTAIGVFSIAPPSELAGAVIKTNDTNIFLNTSRAFTIKGYDKYFNPVEVNPESIKWSVSGVKGTFNGNVFRPTSVGEGKITATIGNVTSTLPVSVLSAPAKLTLSIKTLKLPVGQSRAFTVSGLNKNGFSAIIDPVDLKWTVKGNIGTFENGSFNATARGAGYIDAAMGNTHAYCSVSVSADTAKVVDGFEAANGSFVSYPATVKGAYGISGEQMHSGKSSGKLTYDFTDTEGTRAAYMVLPNGGITLNPGSSKLGVWVYNDHENSCWIRAEITDAKGKKTPDIVRNLDWTGWKYVETALDGIEFPSKLTRLYIVQVNPVADSGSIYLDDLTVVNSAYPAIDPTKIPKDTVPADDANKAVSFTKATDTSFRFGVFGQSSAPDNALEKQLMTKFANKVDAYLEAGVIVGSGSHEAVSKLIKKKKVIATNTVDLSSTKDVDYKYSYTDIKNSRFFKLDMRSKSLRLSDSAQWQKFLADLDSFKGSNVFIMMENSPDKFSDKLEAKFFKDTLTSYKQKSGKNVWVFFRGDKNESYMERGIRYISTVGYDVEGLKPDNTDPATYVLVTVKGNVVTYIFKSII